MTTDVQEPVLVVDRPALNLSSLAARPGDRLWEVRVMHAVRAGLVDEVQRLTEMAERNGASA